MLVKIDNSFNDLPQDELQGHYPTLQSLLHFHLDRKILLHVSLRLVNRLCEDPSFGMANIKILGALIKRAQDYNAALKVLKRHAVVFPDSSKIIPIATHDRMEGYARQLVEFFSHEPRLYLENSINDGKLYAIIMEAIAAQIGALPVLAHARRFHGGGNTLGQAVLDLGEPRLLGMSICDRDGTFDAPPFKANSTGQKMIECGISMNAISQSIPPQPLHPFFRIFATHGWSLENYVGPNTLDTFFQNNHECAAVRARFTAAFGNFPSLDHEEGKEWLLINMKKADQDPDSILPGQHRLELNDDAARRNIIAALSYPSNVIQWISSNYIGSRYSKDIARGIELDLSMMLKTTNLISMATDYYEIFAADSRMRFA